MLDVVVENMWRSGEGSDPEARRLAERALAIKNKNLNQADPDVAVSLFNLGVVLYESEDYSGAMPVLEQCLVIHSQDDLETSSEAGCLRMLGLVHVRIGDYNAARDFLERSVEIRRRVVGPKHPDTAESLNSLAYLLQFVDDYAGARTALEEVLAIREAMRGRDHPEVAGALNNLAVVSMAEGDYVGAKPLLERALRIRKAKLGPRNPRLASTMANLAGVEAMLGHHEEARRLYETSLSIVRSIPDQPGLADYLRDYGIMLVEIGDVDGAEQAYRRSLERYLATDGSGSFGAGKCMQALAKIEYERGAFTEARSLAQQALRNIENAVGSEHIQVAASLITLASLDAERKDDTSALNAALRAEDIGREHLRLTVRSLPERQALRLASVRDSGLDLALFLVSKRAERAQCMRVWNAALRIRGLVLDEMAARNRTVQFGSDVEVFALEKLLVTARSRLANLVVRGPADTDPARYRELLEAAREEKESAERDLAKASLPFRREAETARVGLHEIQAVLEPRDALVAYTAFELHDHGFPSVGKESSARSKVPSADSKESRVYAAFMLPGRTGRPYLLRLGTAKEIDALIDAWTGEAARRPTGNSAEQAERSCRVAGEALRRRIWDPLRPHLKGIKRIFIVPEGELHRVNFAALPTGSQQYLVETEPLLHLLSTERDLVVGRTDERGTGLLVMGGPDFDQEVQSRADGATAAWTSRDPDLRTSPEYTGARGKLPPCPEFDSIRFPRLPAALQEAEDIMGIWNQTLPAAKVAGSRPGDSEASVCLTAGRATEAAFKATAPGKKILHLATHGFFLNGSCLDQAMGSRGVGAMTEDPHGQHSLLGSELLLAGLAMAGANHRESAGLDGEDGILTAEEIASLDLRGVEWAVLSACETGVGEIRDWEGVFGLRRAFHVAGAGTLILSLWPVADDVAREWMRNLYTARLKDGYDTALAVRAASLRLLCESRKNRGSGHPYYWAAFVAAGDWR